MMVSVACLLLVIPFFFPLWSYYLEAPQYPEGISMSIWINKLGGRLDLINGLNHYVGIKPIDPDSFPELKILPWSLAALMLAGLFVALLGRRSWMRGWVVAFVVWAVASLADFYRWLYDYGHDLSPDAPLQIDPFTPALLGTKEIMNFTTTAYPDVGGVAIIIALLLALTAFLCDRPRVPIDKEARRSWGAALVMVLIPWSLTGCDRTPTPIAYGTDACVHCGMIISDPRYGAELVTKTGKVYKFDAIECLATFFLEGRIAREDAHSLWVTNFADPGRLIPTSDAHFLRSPQLHSPMGMNLAAFATHAEREAAKRQHGGSEATWDDILVLVPQSGFLKRHGANIHELMHTSTSRN
jgi:copper chaperone NosL